MSWTTPQDIKNRNPSSGKRLPDDSWLQIRINDVERQIKRRWPKIQERINLDLIEVEEIVDRVADWILEFWQTGGVAITQESQSYTGAGARSVTYNPSNARYTMKLTEEDLLVFAPVDNAAGGFMVIDFAPNKTVPNKDADEVYWPWLGR